MRVSLGFLPRAVVGAALLLCLAASPAAAEWKRAESPHFIVYSQGSERALRRYVRNLEIYDYVLRARMALPVDDQTYRKLPIYLVRDRGDLKEINPRTGVNVAGQYYPVGEDIFAAAIQDSEQDYLLHEYFHHFTFQVPSTSGLPGWLAEGLAEYFMTADIDEESVTIGRYNPNRVYGLYDRPWIPLEELLTKRFSEVERPTHRDSYYTIAWLLTHWFMSDETRRGQLATYMEQVRHGADPLAAMESATGLTLSELRRQLRNYKRLSMLTYEADFPVTEITVTRLGRSADDLLLIGQRLKVGVAEDKRDETAALVRRLAARHPDDTFAMLQLGHAELHFGDPAVGEAVLEKVLEREPENVEALQFMATRFIRLAEDDPDQTIPMLRRARTYLARAYAADPNAYYTLKMLAETREVAPDYPVENDLVAWDRAFRLAPQLVDIRLGYANALMKVAEFDNAILMLEPLANAAHGGGGAQAATVLLDRARARQDPPTRQELHAIVEAAQSADQTPVDPADPDQDGEEPAS